MGDEYGSVRAIRIKEICFLALTIGGLLGLPFWVLAYENSRGHAEERLIRLTGVMKDGVWTEAAVTALNYGLTTFDAAEIRLNVGETARLRLSSADVTHGFYVPELGVGPIEVEPGHVVEVTVRADSTGVYTYYCTTVCGECHHFMRGRIIVGETEFGELPPAMLSTTACLHEGATEQSGDADLVEVGRQLFESRGCVACHGLGGKGGIRNPNYVKEYVPDLNLLAERMFLYEPEDVATVIAMLEQGEDLALRGDDPPFRRFNRFLAQYGSVTDVIRDGKPAARRDGASLDPPLHMPSWEAEISDEEIDAILAYLLAEFPWEAN